jgi:hypothetical protein
MRAVAQGMSPGNAVSPATNTRQCTASDTLHGNLSPSDGPGERAHARAGATANQLQHIDVYEFILRTEGVRGAVSAFPS